MHYNNKDFSKNGLPTMTVRDQELYELQGKPNLRSNGQLTAMDIKQINKSYGCYKPSTSPGALHVKVLQAGPFQDPGHYYWKREIKTRINNRNAMERILYARQIQNGTQNSYSIPMFCSILLTLQSKRLFQTIIIKSYTYRPNDLGGIKTACQ